MSPWWQDAHFFVARQFAPSFSVNSSPRMAAARACSVADGVAFPASARNAPGAHGSRHEADKQEA